VGKALVIDTRRRGVVHRRLMPEQQDSEVARFDHAVQIAAAELRDVAERMKSGAARAESSILEAYILMVGDEMLRTAVVEKISVGRQCAEWSLEDAIADMKFALSASPDPYLAERGHDFQFVGDRLMRALLGEQGPFIPKLSEPTIIVAHDLSPAETAGLSKDTVVALVTEVGTRTSHTSILARALEIPAVVGVGELVSLVDDGELIVVDGLRGKVVVGPTPELVSAIEARAARHVVLTHELRERRGPAVTQDDVQIRVRANIELPAEAALVGLHGGEGIGLYRTEFLFVDRPYAPSEDEQYSTYRYVAEQLAPASVTLRTFDLGGDKFADMIPGPTGANPALGVRAIRFGLAHPEALLPQLRAMVRASAHGRVKILVPMVAAYWEFVEVKRMLAQAIAEVDAAGHPRAEDIPLGAMIEVPSAALMAHLFAEAADFLSIGTNDLVQYTLGVDRTNHELVRLASPFDPAVLGLIHRVVRAGSYAGCPVSVCGAMSDDPLAAALLVGLGIRELSMECATIAEVKEAIRRITVAEAEEVAGHCLGCATAEEAERTVAERFAPRFADLLGD